MFSRRMSSTASVISLAVRPNLLRSPPELSHLPEPFDISFARRPTTGLMFRSRETWISSTSSVKRSITITGWWPRRVASSAVSRKTRSLYPLQISNASGLSISASTASNSGLLPTSSPSPNWRPARSSTSTTCRCWLTLIG
jgi:hypothetical protein